MIQTSKKIIKMLSAERRERGLYLPSLCISHI